MHESVLLKESVDSLHIQSGEKYIDATLGAGGHTAEILARGGKVLGIEADSKMLEIVRKRVGEACPTLFLGNFRNIASLARANGFEVVSGVLFDLGISSVHLDSDERGFSFKDLEAPLDMRLDTVSQGVRAADLLNSLDKTQLTRLLESKSLAQKIVESRQVKPFANVGDLVSLFGNKKRSRVHPATKAFMNLRIAVNSELESLKEALPQAFELLKKGGRLVVISFHSGEDRIVKRYFTELKEKGLAGVSDLVLPGLPEVSRNPRARSAKMRAIYKNENESKQN